MRQVDATGIPTSVDVLNVSAPGAVGAVDLRIGDVLEFREIEPNDAADVAYAITLPCTVNGRIDSAGDTDRFAFTAKRAGRGAFRFAPVGWTTRSTPSCPSRTQRGKRSPPTTTGPARETLG